MDLSEDMISEIFSWLPTKSICKFRTCSKSIYEMTSETFFTLKQSQNSMKNNDSCLFFFIQQPFFKSFKKMNNIETHSLLSHADHHRRHHHQEASSSSSSSFVVPKTFLESLHKSSSKILASSNGLLLCQRSKQQLFICNPITHSCLHIPTTKNSTKSHLVSCLTYAFECNNNNHFEEYKLVAFEYNSLLSYKCLTYIPKEGVWKSREGSFVGHWDMICEPPLIHKEAIHFILQCSFLYNNNIDDFVSCIIATHHFDSGISTYLNLPKEAFVNGQKAYLDMGIFKWGTIESSNESMCFVTLTNRSVFNIWVLNDYDSSSWTGLPTIDLEEIRLSDSFVVGFEIMHGDCLVFASKSSLYKYDLVGERNNNNNNKPEFISEHGLKGAFKIQFISYANTLRSCGNGEVNLSSLEGMKK